MNQMNVLSFAAFLQVMKFEADDWIAYRALCVAPSLVFSVFPDQIQIEH